MNLSNEETKTQRTQRMKKDLQNDLLSKRFSVYVDDNFHYMDESERYKLGTFETCEEAIAACKKIVDDFLEEGYRKGMAFNKLIEEYIFFGEDPFIASSDKTCFFSAHDYAHKRCLELYGEEK